LSKIEPTTTPFFPFPAELEAARLDTFAVEAEAEAEAVVDDIFQRILSKLIDNKNKVRLEKMEIKKRNSIL
jgi:hypothetical protein